MDRAAFTAAASAVGISDSQSAALYARLYDDAPPLTQPVWPGSLAAAPVAPPATYAELSRLRGDFNQESQLTRAIQVLVWLGVMLVVGAHGWWTASGYEDLGYSLVLMLTLLWQAGFLGAADWARRQGHGSLEAGFAGIVAFYTPLSIYSLQRLAGFDFEREDYRGFYEWVSGGWVFMEIGAIAVTVALLWRYRRPFVTLPLTLFAGFLLMDGADHVIGSTDGDYDSIERVVLIGGAVTILAAIALDLRGWRRFAFWPHVIGIWLVGWGIPLFLDGAKWSLYVCAVIFLALGIWLARIVHLVSGGLMTWIAVSLSAEGAMLPFVLMGGGIAFIALAIWLSQRDSPVRRWLAEQELRVEQRDLDY